MRGRTTLVIAHRPATIALADRVAVVERGRVVDEGTHAELLDRSARYRALLALAEREEAAA
jgi:ATP-binding cassette subfamily B protein